MRLSLLCVAYIVSDSYHISAAVLKGSKLITSGAVRGSEDRVALNHICSEANQKQKLGQRSIKRNIIQSIQRKYLVTIWHVFYE